MALSFYLGSTQVVINISNLDFAIFLVMTLVILHLIVLKQVRKRTIKFANYETLKKALGRDILKSNILPLLLRLFAIICFILALSTFKILVVKPVSDADFVIAIDVSQTMLNSDNGKFIPNRLGAAKSSAEQIIEELPQSTYIGLISFSGKSHLIHDLSNNKEDLIASLESIKPVPPAGTVIGDAIVMGSTLLSNSTKTKRVMVLITDGKQTPSMGVDINSSITFAKHNGVVIDTIGIGKRNKTIINLTGINLKDLPPEIVKEIKERNETYVAPELDEGALKYIANETHGKYFYVENNSAMKEALNTAILKYNSVTIDARTYALIAGIIFLLLEWLLGATKYKTIP